MAVTFREKIKTISDLLKNYSELKALISLKHSGYLKDVGWFNAFNSKSSIDGNNNPIPWTTYSFIEFISSRLNNNLSVFEYGSGNSTLFYSSRVKHVTAVEHNMNWFDKMAKQIPDNVKLIFKEEDIDGDYCRSITLDKTRYDIIIIDAVDRVNCMKVSYDFLTDKGIIILDDSNRNEYEEGIFFLTQKGFKIIDFWGISPGYFNKKCTSIFYKSINCLSV